MIQSLLIANRGEIACRIIRTQILPGTGRIWVRKFDKKLDVQPDVLIQPIKAVRRARELRKEMSLPETILWRELRKRPGGLKYRRQHPAGKYILDFYCAAAKLAIEVDGHSHDGHIAAKADAARGHFLRSQGVATLRVPVSAVLGNLEGAVLRIVEVCEERVGKLAGRRGRETPSVPLHHPSDGPPPRAGEEL